MTAGEQEARRIPAERFAPGEARLLAAAVLALMAARIRFACLPTARLVRDLQAGGGSAPGGAADRRPDPAVPVLARSLARAAARVPWRADCLIQALAMDRLLRRRGHRPQFHLGVSRTPAGAFAAHAWLVCDGVTVSGGAAGDFSVLIGPDEPGGAKAGEGAG